MTPNMVITVTAIDTHGSWHISLASLFWGISKAVMASDMGSLCNVMVVTSVHNFLCLKVRHAWGIKIQASTQLVVRYSMWAGVENKNEPFLGFSVGVCCTTGKKGELGETGDCELMEWNSFTRVSGVQR